MAVQITKLTSRGQVVIPQGIRRTKRLKEGEQFLVYDTEDSIVLKRLKGLEGSRSRDEFERLFRSLWKTAKRRAVSKKDVAAQIAAYRAHA